MFKKSRMVWELIEGQRVRYAASVAALFLGTLFAYFIPLVGQIAIDNFIAGKKMAAPAFVLRLVARAGGPSVLAHDLWVAALLILFFSALSGVFVYLRGRWSAIASEAIAQRLRDQMYDHMQHLPCAYHDKADTGDLVQRCTSDIETIRLFLSAQVVEIGRAVVMVVSVLPIMLWMSPRMTAVSMLVMPPILAFAIIFFVRVKAAFKRSDEAEGRLTTMLQENLSGIRVVRAFARQEFECERFATSNDAYRDLTWRLIVLLAFYWSCSDLMCISQGGLVLFTGAGMLMRGSLTVGTLFAFLAYENMLLWPIRQMGRILADLGKAQVSFGRLQEVLLQEREEKTAPAPAASRLRIKGGLAVKGLSYAYAGGKPVLRNVSFTVEPGQTLAILGPSGAGKSTLVHLLLRLYEYGEGSIAVDGHELSGIGRATLRSQVGVVLQEPFLYAKSLRDNIKLGRAHLAAEGVEEAAVIQVATAVCMHESIQGFEAGYDTLVGERGVTLSGGQRQRIALARAILKDPAILILDDALSAVDVRTESMILEALRRRQGRRTTLVIAHRLSTLMQADQILVLDHGRMVQAGTHHELVRQEGMYQRLWQIQSSLEEDLGEDMQSSGAPGGPGEEGPDD